MQSTTPKTDVVLVTIFEIFWILGFRIFTFNKIPVDAVPSPNAGLAYIFSGRNFNCNRRWSSLNALKP